LDSNSDNPRSETQQETSILTEGTSSNQLSTSPLNMNEQRERDEEEEEEPRIVPRNIQPWGMRGLPTYNGREDLARYLVRYKLACGAYNEGSKINLLRLFPLALTGIVVDWFLDMDKVDRLAWKFLETAFIKRFGSNKLMDNPIRILNTIHMKHSENVYEYIDHFNRI